jgi:hypothetical protein
MRLRHREVNHVRPRSDHQQHALAGVSEPQHLWAHIFQQLERNKFRLDLAQVPERELELLRTLAGAQGDEINPRHFIPAFQYAHFGRLTEKGLLIRTGRGRYKLYHPLFREFLRQAK